MPRTHPPHNKTHLNHNTQVEREMAALLAAVEAQKAASAAKIRQLASLLHEM